MALRRGTPRVAPASGFVPGTHPGRRARAGIFALGCFVLLLVPHADADSADKPAEVRLVVTSPAEGEVVRNRVTMAAVRGRAESGEGDRSDFDVMVVVDVSHSTRYPAGIDVDQDGELGIMWGPMMTVLGEKGAV